MISNKSGCIINISSTYGITGAAAILAYAACKAGIISITKSLANELAEHGIRVNCIAPGNFDTDMTAEAEPEIMNWILATTPLKRLGKPYEIGEAVVFLVTAEFITGQTLIIDGGQGLRIA